MPRLVSYAQNGEDVRIWHAFGPREPAEPLGSPLVYVEVGANEPRHFSVTAALFDLGWRGLLVEADPELTVRLKDQRPGDYVVQAAAGPQEGEMTFFRVPGTGLGTADPKEAQRARERGFEVVETTVPVMPLDRILDNAQLPQIHVLTIDVEGAEESVLRGLSLTNVRPWVICIEAVELGGSTTTHERWQSHLLDKDYREVAFDGINRWYVAAEHAHREVDPGAGAPPGTTIAEAIATPFNVLDHGTHGWITEETAQLADRDNRNFNRQAWQRELILNDIAQQVPAEHYEQQIHELRSTLNSVESSRAFTISRAITKVGRRFRHLVHRVKDALPSPLAHRIIRERHLRHVTINMGHLTDPAYLGNADPSDPRWITPNDPNDPDSAPRPPVPPGLELERFSKDQAQQVRQWLNEFPFDSDEQLDARMDNHDDEVGRARTALRSRLRLLETHESQPVSGNRVVIDARSLQSPAFGNRGIGRFAKATLLGARQAIGDDLITLIVDRGFLRLPEDLAGECEQITHVRSDRVSEFALLIQPSPMTHSPDPLIPLLNAGVDSLAVVFDFIPMHYPSVYLWHVAARAEYAANLDALKKYREFVCISRVAERELQRFLEPTNSTQALTTPRTTVAWPREVIDAARNATHVAEGNGPIVLVTGDEPRKNTFGGLAGIAAATSNEAQRSVVVVGMAGHSTRVHHWSIAAAMRPGEAVTAERISDDELTALLSRASCVVVPSFDEGLSLPVIEAVHAGAPVVASNIASHRELIGTGRFSCDPVSPRSIATAVRRTQGKTSVWKTQQRRLARTSHPALEDVIASAIRERALTERPLAPPIASKTHVSSSRRKVAVASPWSPQRTGVADFSTTVFTELAEHVDLTVFTTSSADTKPENPSIQYRDVEEIAVDPEAVLREFDAILTVVGNSHFHLPFVELLRHVPAVAIAHDTRMVEYYLALRGKGGVEQVMLRTDDPDAPTSITPSLDEQIDDMRLLQNAGMWEIANRATELVLHSVSAAGRIERETGRGVHVLPFANQRVPEQATVTDADRQAAKQRLNLTDLPSQTIHLACFGYVDVRTKLTDVVVESAAWLAQWGYPVALHLVGAASPQQERELSDRAREAGIEHFQITGFQSEERFRDWLLATDIGIQLRISPLLGVSGPLSDLAAFGTPAVASTGLCVDVDTPEFIHRLPDAVSPVIVAEAIEQLITNPMPADEREALRKDYLAGKTPEIYVRQLLDVIERIDTRKSGA